MTFSLLGSILFSVVAVYLKMQSHISCECGNLVDVSGDPADVEHRCARCGRRVFTNDDDAAEYHSALEYPQQKPASVGAEPKTQNTVHAPMEPQHHSKFDPDATVIHSVVPSDHGKAGMPGDVSTLLTRHGDFEVNYQQPVDDDSQTLQATGSSPNASSPSVKYDLSKRVMRAISKPRLPIVPYNGTGEYGIHRILRLLQRGGMGRILVAYDPYLKREVAIKELHADVAEDESIVQRFIGEAEITAQLEHPGVVPIHRLGQGREGLPYYTMKMIKGVTLQDAIKAYHRQPSKSELMNLVRRLVSVSKTIAFSHSKGVIHRDLKPANVMIGEHGETLVVDWGLAKPYNYETDDTYVSIVHKSKQSRPELTMVGALVGTPAFMSPEQAMAEESMVGPLSDVFSLGAILYYLLVGQTAFSGRSTQEVINKVRACNPVPPSQIKSNIPHGLEMICLKAMAKLPEKRYQGASEFADDLCRWLDGEPIAAEKASLRSTIYRWVLRHRVELVTVPIILVLSLILAFFEIWVVEQDHEPFSTKAATVNPGGSEFKNAVVDKSSPGHSIWIDSRYTGEMRLVCRTKGIESETNHLIRIHAPDGEAWDLSKRHSLTFSLLEIYWGENKPIQNFCIRLGSEMSYFEYKPSDGLWENRNRQDWDHFTILLEDGQGDWTRDSNNDPEITEIEWLAIYFETNSEMVLDFDNLKFCGK